MQSDPSQALAEFAAELRYEDIPPTVIARSEDLFLDWFASALAGKSSPPVAEMRVVFDRAWNLRRAGRVERFLA